MSLIKLKMKLRIVTVVFFIIPAFLTEETKPTKLDPNDYKIIENFKDINAKPRKGEILDMILGSTYDIKSRPLGSKGSGPVKVGVTVYVINIENLDDVQMEYTTQIICRQEWLDPRLNYSQIQNNIPYLQLLETSRVWVPDLVFSNEKEGSLHDLMFPNLFIRIFPDGQILFSARVTLKLSCLMDLHYFPMDLQTCSIIMGSYAWTTEDIVLAWADDKANVQISKGINLPKFKLESYHNYTCDFLVTRTGSYDCVELRLEFKREFEYYFIQIYTPCAMLVVVSWVSFWLEPTATEARISLCVTSILTVVTQTYGINQSVPPASYVKSIDVWLFAVQFMVFASILQFSYVNYLARFQWKATLKELRISNEELRKSKGTFLKEEGERKAKRVDAISKISFPLFFFIFNIVYWSVYLNPPRDVSRHSLYIN